MNMEWREGWSGLLDAIAGFHDGVVQGMDLTSRSHVRTDFSMVRPGGPADVRLLVQLQNEGCPAVLIDFVNVLECSWDNDRDVENAEPEDVGPEFKRYSVLQFTAVAGGVVWLPLDERALGGNAARHRRATGQ